MYHIKNMKLDKENTKQIIKIVVIAIVLLVALLKITVKKLHKVKRTIQIIT